MNLAILQARMGSNRLPGKVLKKDNDIPLLKYQCDRLAKSKKINQLIIATSIDTIDNEIEEFAQALYKSIQLADWHQVSLHRPFVGMTKADIVALGAKLKVPFEKTWSCYKGGTLHCGRCGTCIERREAFYLSKICDPTIYESSAPSVSEMVYNS